MNSSNALRLGVGSGVLVAMSVAVVIAYFIGRSQNMGRELASWTLVFLLEMLVLSAFSYWVHPRAGASRVQVVAGEVTRVIGIAALVAIAAGGLLTALTALRPVAAELLERLPARGPLLLLAAGALTTLIGVAFFVFRLRQRCLYGATEVVAGTSFAMYRMAQEPVPGIPTEAGFYIAWLTAGVYLVVRGLDNIHQGLEKGDRVGKAVIAALTDAVGNKSDAR